MYQCGSVIRLPSFPHRHAKNAEHDTQAAIIARTVGIHARIIAARAPCAAHAHPLVRWHSLQQACKVNIRAQKERTVSSSLQDISSSSPSSSSSGSAEPDGDACAGSCHSSPLSDMLSSLLLFPLLPLPLPLPLLLPLLPPLGTASPSARWPSTAFANRKCSCSGGSGSSGDVLSSAASAALPACSCTALPAAPAACRGAGTSMGGREPLCCASARSSAASSTLQLLDAISAVILAPPAAVAGCPAARAGGAWAGCAAVPSPSLSSASARLCAASKSPAQSQHEAVTCYPKYLG